MSGDHRRGQVQARAPGSSCRPAAGCTSSYLRLHHQYADEEHQLEDGRGRGREHRSSIGTSSWCWSTAWTWPRHGPFSMPARSTLTSCVPCTSRGQPGFGGARGRVGSTGTRSIAARRRGMRRPAAGPGRLELAAETVADQETEMTILLPRRGFATGSGIACSTMARPTGSPPGSHNSPRECHRRALSTHSVAGSPSGAFVRPIVSQQTTGRPPRVTGTRSDRSLDGADGRAAERQEAVSSFERLTADSDVAMPGRPRPSARWSGVSAFGSQGGSSRCAPSPGPAPRTSSVSWPTAPAKFCWSSKVGAKIAGIEPGARLVAEGMVGDWARRQAILNPAYELVQASSEANVRARVNHRNDRRDHQPAGPSNCPLRRQSLTCPPARRRVRLSRRALGPG